MAERDDKHLSKCVSWLLRHGAVREGLRISSEGYVDVCELLSHRSLRNYTVDDIKRVVRTNDKQRFTLREQEGKLEIRANQGHSLNIVKDLELIPIESFDAVPSVIHGTYKRFWPKIKQEGLKCMNRNHIHFSTGLPADKEVISGMRRDVEILIYINLKKALDNGLKFYLSLNGVVLSSGNSGTIHSKYFLKVCDRKGTPLN